MECLFSLFFFISFALTSLNLSSFTHSPVHSFLSSSPSYSFSFLLPFVHLMSYFPFYFCYFYTSMGKNELYEEGKIKEKVKQGTKTSFFLSFCFHQKFSSLNIFGDWSWINNSGGKSEVEKLRKESHNKIAMESKIQSKGQLITFDDFY